MKRGVLLVLFTAIISGVSIFINQFGVKGIDSTLFTFGKNIVVSVFLLAIILGINQFRELRKLGKKDWLSLIFIGFIGGSIPFVLFFKGLQMSNGAVGSFIHKTMFIFVAVIAMIFLKEKLSWKILVPASLLLMGNFLVLKVASFDFSVGLLLVLFATVFWAVENVISKKVLQRIGPMTVAFGRMFFGSLFILAYMLISGINMSYNASQISWVMVTSLFLLLYVVTWYTGLKEVNVTTATSILLLGSPVTTLLGFVFNGNPMGVLQMFGIICTAVGVIYMVLFTERKYYKTISQA